MNDIGSKIKKPVSIVYLLLVQASFIVLLDIISLLLLIGDVISDIIVTNKSDHIIIFLLVMIWTTVLLSMNLIPITTKTLSAIVLATEYGSTNNVILLEAKKRFCFSIGYVNNLWLLCLYIIIKVSIIIRSLYVG